MQLKVFVCLLLVLPAALAQCADIQYRARQIIDVLPEYWDRILAVACDKPSKIAILKHMVKNFEELLFRLGKPCVLAYSPTHFQSPFCIQLQWDYGALFELLTGFNWEVDQLCQYQCSVPNDYADKVKEYIGKLLDILNNL